MLPSLSPWLLLAVVPTACILPILLPFLTLLTRQYRSPLKRLGGPPSPSLFMGNLMDMHDQENNNLLQKWSKKYGPVYVYRGFVGGCRLMLTDPRAVAHVLAHAYDYPKPDFVRDSLASMAAGYEGLLTCEGDVHKRQRKILGPAFSSPHVKSLEPIFWDKVEHLRDIWLEASDRQATIPLPNPDSVALSTPKDKSGRPLLRVDALVWLGRATLDVIGVAGFGYTFNALNDATPSILPTKGNASPKADKTENPLAAAFSVIFSTARKFRVMTILQVWFPILRRFRRNNAVMIQAQATMRRIGLELIHHKMYQVARDAASFANPTPDMIEGDKTILGRDLLSVLIRSNTSVHPSQQMTEEEILCQISTFIAAGHETTASSLTWTLYALAKDPVVQAKLRMCLARVDREVDEEIALADANATPEALLQLKRTALAAALSKCQYLEWVLRESLRLHAPVTSTMRVCMRDVDEIPVGGESRQSQSEKSTTGYTDKYGAHRDTIRINKYDIISIPIQAINRSELWGPDAGEFRYITFSLFHKPILTASLISPERWENPPDSINAIPGLYAHLLTFLNGNGSTTTGNRACIGYKFALSEMRIFLYVLLRDLEYSMDPTMIVEKRINVVTRPVVKSEPHLGNQMPLFIRRVPVAEKSSQLRV